MNDHELDLALADFGAHRVEVSAPPMLRQRIRTMPLSSEAGRGWLPESPKWRFTMFSALKFVVASVIVALFGGFLLAGVFTMEQGDEVVPAAVTASPTSEATSEPTEEATTSVRTDILPGVELTVEEVDSGVFHVVNDGVRPITPGRNTDIVAGHDDGIWLLQQNRFIRLGSEADQAWPEAGGPYRPDFEVTPDGTVWVIQVDEIRTEEEDFRTVNRLFSSDGDGWTSTRSPSGSVFSIEVAPDGTLWASWDEGDPEVGYLGLGGWQLIGNQGLGLPPHRLLPTAYGDIYGEVCLWGCWVRHYQDGEWPVMQAEYQLIEIASDGSRWAVRDGLARFTGDELEEWGPLDLPDMGLGIALEEREPDPLRERALAIDRGALLATFMVAPDGSLWASRWQRGPDGDDPPAHGLWSAEQRGNRDRYDPQCDGLVRFDGETTRRFLPGRCITMDIAADGSVWVLADADEKGKDLYAITTEAVVGTD